ncbi:MAG: HlyD family efflux transporter periplasmic adaptor subunit [Bacillota bacterium]
MSYKNNNIYYLSQNKKDYKNYQKKKRKKSIFIILILIFILFLFAYFYLIKSQPTVFIAEQSELVDGFETECLLVRNEKVFRAEESGEIEFFLTEGERAGYGQKVMKIGDKTVYNNESGLVSYATDGLEDIVNTNTLSEITIDQFDSYQRKYKQLIEGNYIQTGQAAYRIIKNNNMYIVIKTNSSEASRYWVNEKVFIKISLKEDRLIEAYVQDIAINGNTGLLKIKLDIFLKEWLNLRWAEVIFIKNIYRGISIPRKAIFTSPEGEGVLVYTNDGDIKFKKITRGNENENMVIVEGIELGEKVIINPVDINYGRGV